MKTLYEKASNLANYVRDIMYMQKYYMDCYAEVSVIRTARMSVTPTSSYERIRGYGFETANPELEDGHIFQIIKRDSDYKNDYVMTLTSSYSHIKNNTQSSAPKYFHVQYPINESMDFENSLDGIHRDLLKALRIGICDDTIKETEFQQQMIHPDHLITGLYLFLLLNEDINAVQYDNKMNVVLCLASTDIKTFVPARKAFIDLLDKKVSNGWRQTIQQRYGHVIA